MRAVLYTFDFEPITVLELPSVAGEYFRKHDVFWLAVLAPLPTFAGWSDAAPRVECRQVRIVAELLRRGNREHYILFTADEESALLLKAAFLPGQYAAVKDRERSAFAKGFVEAILRLGE